MNLLGQLFKKDKGSPSTRSEPPPPNAAAREGDMPSADEQRRETETAAAASDPASPPASPSALSPPLAALQPVTALFREHGVSGAGGHQN